MERDGKGGVEAASEERAGATVEEAMDGVAEGPAEDGVDGDIVTKGDGEVDGGAVGECVREGVRDDGAKEAAEVRRVERGCVANGASKADRLERLRGIVKFGEINDAIWVGVGECAMIRVEAAVEAGARVEKGGQWSWGRIVDRAEVELDRGKSMGDSDGNGSCGGSG